MNAHTTISLLFILGFIALLLYRFFAQRWPSVVKTPETKID